MSCGRTPKFKPKSKTKKVDSGKEVSGTSSKSKTKNDDRTGKHTKKDKGKSTSQSTHDARCSTQGLVDEIFPADLTSKVWPAEKNNSLDRKKDKSKDRSIEMTVPVRVHKRTDS